MRKTRLFSAALMAVAVSIIGIPAASATTPLNLDWDTCNNTQWTSTGNGSIEAGDPAHQLQVVSSPTRTGTGCSARFETHNSPTDQVSNGTYRSLECKYDTSDASYSGDDFVYGFSFMVPDVPLYEHIWELHQLMNINNVNPNLALAPHAVLIRNGQLQYRMMTGKALWNGSTWTGYESYNDQIPLTGALQPNAAYDVAIHIKASETSTGLIQVYVRQAGQAWPSTPTWSKSAPTVQWIPGGLDPKVPHKISTFDTYNGLKGLYVCAGVYNGSNVWQESLQQVIVYIDNLRRYTDLTSAAAGFPT